MLVTLAGAFEATVTVTTRELKTRFTEGVAAGAGERGEHAAPAAAAERGRGQARWQRVGHRDHADGRTATDVGDRERVQCADLVLEEVAGVGLGR